MRVHPRPAARSARIRRSRNERDDPRHVNQSGTAPSQAEDADDDQAAERAGGEQTKRRYEQVDERVELRTVVLDEDRAQQARFAVRITCSAATFPTLTLDVLGRGPTWGSARSRRAAPANAGPIPASRSRIEYSRSSALVNAFQGCSSNRSRVNNMPLPTRLHGMPSTDSAREADAVEQAGTRRRGDRSWSTRPRGGRGTRPARPARRAPSRSRDRRASRGRRPNRRRPPRSHRVASRRRGWCPSPTAGPAPCPVRRARRARARARRRDRRELGRVVGAVVGDHDDVVHCRG